jgi:hypothetical protein
VIVVPAVRCARISRVTRSRSKDGFYTDPDVWDIPVKAIIRRGAQFDEQSALYAEGLHVATGAA